MLSVRKTQRRENEHLSLMPPNEKLYTAEKLTAFKFIKRYFIVKYACMFKQQELSER